MKHVLVTMLNVHIKAEVVTMFLVDCIVWSVGITIRVSNLFS